MNTRLESACAPNQVELSTLDLRYESCRMKLAALEQRLLGSIAERGIEEALEGVQVGESRILLNGFKRYRCARKLKIALVPFTSLGRDQTAGIVTLLRAARDRALGILEQAAFIDELKHAGNLSLAQIAAELSRSKAWVSLRLGLIGEMSAPVRQKLFAGAFPVYACMYTLRPFMRLNGGCEAGRAVCIRSERTALERARDRAPGPGLLPRAGNVAGGDRAGQPGAAAAADASGAGERGRLRRVRARDAAGSGGGAKLHAAGDGQSFGCAAAQRAIFGPGAAVDGGDFEPGAGVSGRGEEAA